MKTLLLLGLLFTSSFSFAGDRENCKASYERADILIKFSMKTFNKSVGVLGTDNAEAFSGFLKVQEYAELVSNDHFKKLYNKCGLYISLTEGKAKTLDAGVIELLDSVADSMKLKKLYGLAEEMINKYGDLVDKLNAGGSKDEVRNTFIPLVMEIDVLTDSVFKEALIVLDDDDIISSFAMEVVDRAAFIKNQSVSMKIELKKILDSLMDYLNDN